jgi:hypothetical protein
VETEEIVRFSDARTDKTLFRKSIEYVMR